MDRPRTNGDCDIPTSEGEDGFTFVTSMLLRLPRPGLLSIPSYNRNLVPMWNHDPEIYVRLASKTLLELRGGSFVPILENVSILSGVPSDN